MDTIGVDRLEAAKITPAMIGDGTDSDGSALADLQLPDADAAAMYDAFAACDVDVHASFVESIRATGRVDDAAVDCFGNAIDDDLLRRIMIVSIATGPSSVTDDPSVQEAWSAAVASCGPMTTTTGG
jgi:hypothetical protein